MLNPTHGERVAFFAGGLVLGMIVDFKTYPAFAMTGLISSNPILFYALLLLIPLIMGSLSVFSLIVWKMLGKTND